MTKKTKALTLSAKGQIIRSVLILALRYNRTRGWAAGVIDSWSKAPGAGGRDFRSYWVACDLQPYLAKAMSWKICDFCRWAEDPNSLHEYCREQLAPVCPQCRYPTKIGEECRTCKEIDAAWEAWLNGEDDRVVREEDACWAMFDKDRRREIERDQAEYNEHEL